MRWTEDDLNERRLAKGGEYNAKVSNAEERQDKNGNPYMSVRLDVETGGGNTSTMFDNLWLRHLEPFCESAGLQQQFRAGCLTAHDCLGRTVRVRVSHEENSSGYLQVAAYLPLEAKGVAQVGDAASAERPNVPGAGAAADVDEIPF